MAQTSGNETRYRRLESIRQYACGKLIESGEFEHLCNQHLKYFLQLSEQAESALRGPTQIEWMSRLNDERDNIRAALEWAEKTDLEAGMHLAGRLHAFWESFDVREGARWLAVFIDNPESKVYILARARALLVYGWLLQWVGQLAIGRSVAQESLELYRVCGDQLGEADALALLAWIFNDAHLEKSAQGLSIWTSNVAQAMDFLKQALSLARKLGDRGRQARILAMMSWVDEDKDGRRSHLREAIVLLREVGDLHWLGQYLHDLAHQELLAGNLESAQELLNAAVIVNQQLNSKALLGENSALNGHIELIRGNFKQARAKLSEGLSILEGLGNWHFVLWSRVLLGQVAVREGSLTEAREIFVKNIHNFQHVQNLIGVLFTLEGTAGFFTAIGQLGKAARLIGWADEIREKIPDHRPILEQRDVNQIILDCIAEMGDVAFAREYEKGKGMTVDEAVACALESIRDQAEH
jgi:tetratricopeptide (TPR) repeat protein